MIFWFIEVHDKILMPDAKHSLAVRKIDETEIPALRGLALDIWPKAFAAILSRGQIRYMLEMMYSDNSLKRDFARNVRFFILNCDGQDAGFAAMEKIDGRYHKLHKIYVAQKLHGRGVGKFLLQDMENRAREAGAKYLTLNVNRANRATDFYRSRGYAITDTVDIDIGNGFFMNDYVMVKGLI